MPLEEAVWFVPWQSDTGALQTVYEASGAPPGDPTAIATGRAFTVSIEAVKLAAAPSATWYQRVMHQDTDVLVLTSSALGAKPLVERVHYYKTHINPKQPLLAHDMLSDVVWVCDDYQEPDPFYVEIQVVTVDRSDEAREAALKGFETLASVAGSVFPVALPYLAMGDGILEGLNKLWEAAERRESYRVSEPIRLFPPSTPRAKTIRAGRFVVLSERLDATRYRLGDDGTLATGNDGTLATGDDHEVVGASGTPLSYAVIRIDPTREPQPDYVVSQRAATLLTQLKNDRDGQPAGALQTSFGFLTDTLRAYTNFTDLRRFQQLAQKGDQRTPGETEQMRRLAQRPELQPFLPKSGA